MRTTPDLFEAYLRCPTKCWLRSRGEVGGGNEYADWVRSQNESYLRIGSGESAIQHSLWADTVADEEKIWGEFLAILETVEKPVLIHYGSYETTFLKEMKERHCNPADKTVVAASIASSINLVSVMFATLYFPTFTNGLKEIGQWLGFEWRGNNPLGLDSIRWRHEW